MLYTVHSYQRQIYSESNTAVFKRHRHTIPCGISGFRREADVICALLGGQGVQYFGFLGPLKMGQRSCSETSVRNYHYLLRNITGQRRFNLRFSKRSVLQCINSDYEIPSSRMLTQQSIFSSKISLTFMGPCIIRIF